MSLKTHQVNNDGDVLLRKIVSTTPIPLSDAGDKEAAASADPKRLRLGVCLDTETTGVDPMTDTVIEIALVPFAFFVVDEGPFPGEVVAVGQPLVALQDPGAPLSAEIQAITGLTDADVTGQVIDWAEVRGLLSEADVVIAWNAGFDRKLVDRAIEVAGLPFLEKVWGCAMADLSWPDAPGHSASKPLATVCAWYGGFWFDAHRALIDTVATLRLLAHTGRAGELLAVADQPAYEVHAVGSPFATKDLLKARKYTWDGTVKTWWKAVAGKEEAKREVQWLASDVYQRSLESVKLIPGLLKKRPATLRHSYKG